jgi:uncharacterized cupredoxin-like copper-binding protein
MRAIARARLLVAALLLVGAMVTVSACNAGNTPPAGATKVTLTEFKFSPAEVSVSAGRVAFHIVNSGTRFHEFVIFDSAGRLVAKSDRIQAGDSQVLTVDNLKAGKYRIVCEVAGHMESGMTGTLISK